MEGQATPDMQAQQQAGASMELHYGHEEVKDMNQYTCTKQDPGMSLRSNAGADCGLLAG